MLPNDNFIAQVGMAQVLTNLLLLQTKMMVSWSLLQPTKILIKLVKKCQAYKQMTPSKFINIWTK